MGLLPGCNCCPHHHLDWKLLLNYFQIFPRVMYEAKTIDLMQLQENYIYSLLQISQIYQAAIPLRNMVCLYNPKRYSTAKPANRKIYLTCSNRHTMFVIFAGKLPAVLFSPICLEPTGSVS